MSDLPFCAICRVSVWRRSEEIPFATLGAVTILNARHSSESTGEPHFMLLGCQEALAAGKQIAPPYGITQDRGLLEEGWRREAERIFERQVAAHPTWKEQDIAEFRKQLRLPAVEDPFADAP